MALLRAVRETPEERVEWLAGVYLDPTALPGRRAQLIDAFVESGSLAAQRVVVKYVSEQVGGGAVEEVEKEEELV